MNSLVNAFRRYMPTPLSLYPTGVRMGRRPPDGCVERPPCGRYLATWSQSERAVFFSGTSKSVIAAIHLAKELSPRSTNWR